LVLKLAHNASGLAQYGNRIPSAGLAELLFTSAKLQMFSRITNADVRYPVARIVPSQCYAQYEPAINGFFIRRYLSTEESISY